MAAASSLSSMAEPLVFVKDGMAYTHRAEPICPVEVDDGYYQGVLLTWIASKGKAKSGGPNSKNKSAEHLIPCSVISEYPHLVDAKGYTFTIGSLNVKTEIGETILVDKRNYCYYIPDQKSGTLLEDLAEWFIKFKVKSPWIVGKNGHRLTPARARWAKRFPNGDAIWSIVNSDNRDFMRPPDNLQKAVVPRIKKRLGLLKSKLNKQIEPIGGKITSICPDWQKGIALVWVRFTINGVDPTHGGGCLCYLNGDFYYGPWCQRPRQKDLAGKIELLHDYPPKYTLRTWITGPLYSTALYAKENPGAKLESAISSSPPAYFEPTGVVMLAKGTSRTTEDDGVKVRTITAKEAKRLSKERSDMLQEKMADGLKDELVQHMNGLFVGQRVFGTHKPFSRVSIQWPFTSSGIYNYLKTDGQDWMVCVTLYPHEQEYFEVPKDLVGVEYSAPVSKGGYGFEKEQFQNGSWQVFSFAAHYQLIVKGCSCEKCDAMRRKVGFTITKTEQKKKTPSELLAEITKTEFPF